MGTIRQAKDAGHDYEPQSGERVRPRRILVAEGDSETRHRVACALRADGYVVIEASNGFELLEHISSSLLVGDAVDTPDAIIMGIWMPGVSGLSILGGLRDANWSTPILLLSGYLGPELCEMYRHRGATAIFEKPFDIDDLRTVVINLVPRGIRDGGRHGASPSVDDAFAATG